MDAQAAARRWAATWTAAWRAHDVEAVVALYADDCVHRSTPFRPPHRGRQGVRDYVTQAFADEQRIDEVRFDTPVVQGDRACVEYRARFLDQQGTAMTLAGCAMAQFDADGLITEARDYWHLEEEHAVPATTATPTVTPMLSYQDAAAALGWLANAYGFHERTRSRMPDGSIGHAEMQLGDGVIMLAEPGPDYQGPTRHAETCEAARRWLATPYVIDGVHVYVEDVDGHFERARQAGATILSEPEDTGYGRSYRTADLEGHRWMFTQR